MLTMANINDIRSKFFDEGKNLSRIARETGHDRKTIRKYITKEDWNEEPAKDTRASKLDEYKPLIKAWLEMDKHQRRKQRHTARRVYQRLRDEAEGFDCSYRTVCNYVGEVRRCIYQARHGYLPLQHLPGEAQIDFGEADLIENTRCVSGTCRAGAGPKRLAVDTVRPGRCRRSHLGIADHHLDCRLFVGSPGIQYLGTMNSCTVGLISGNPSVMTALAGG